jgi:hypothetical protein
MADVDPHRAAKPLDQAVELALEPAILTFPALGREWEGRGEGAEKEEEDGGAMEANCATPRDPRR